MKLTDMIGEPVVLRVPDDLKTGEFLSPNLKNGIYFIKVQNAAGSSVSKLIKI